jgi:hypothetical protein
VNQVVRSIRLPTRFGALLAVRLSVLAAVWAVAVAAVRVVASGSVARFVGTPVAGTLAAACISAPSHMRKCMTSVGETTWHYIKQPRLQWCPDISAHIATMIRIVLHRSDHRIIKIMVT